MEGKQRDKLAKRGSLPNSPADPKGFERSLQKLF
jgi:hypothetical protein